MRKLPTPEQVREYKTKMQSAIYLHLDALGIKHKYANFSVQLENPRMNDYRFFHPRLIIFYNHISFSRFDVNKKNVIDNDIEFIFSSPWLISQLFNIVCRLKRK